MSIHLFVQDGCRPCLYAKSQLDRVEGWEDVVTITQAKADGELTQFAKECGVEVTPTLVALSDSGEVLAHMTESTSMTKEFWTNTINKHRKSQ